MSLADASSCLVAHLQRVAADLQTIEHALEAEFRRRYAGEVSRKRNGPPSPAGGSSTLTHRLITGADNRPWGRLAVSCNFAARTCSKSNHQCAG